MKNCSVHLFGAIINRSPEFPLFCHFVYAYTQEQAQWGLMHAVSYRQLVLRPPLSLPAAVPFILSLLCSCRSQSPSPLCFSQVRKFVSKDSAGLRVRSHPSLQSEQIGIVHVNGTITFIDEVIDSRLGRILVISYFN